MTIPGFESQLKEPLLTHHPDCLQVNLGKLCNQACRHCHVDAGPKRTEIMTRETLEQVLDAVDFLNVSMVDITGGAPEMNPHFIWFIEALRKRKVPRIIDRCNLTILLEPGYEQMAEFLAANEIEITASLPYYHEDFVDRQRGRGVFNRSIEALRLLNRHGYGKELPLNLVYNPQGAYLPPDQEELHEIYSRQLHDHFDIVFNDLYTITNMPISRFRDYLERSGNYRRYMKKLVSRFNHETLPHVMCRSLISVGWDGSLYDCDFNQMLEIPVHSESQRHISQIRDLVLKGRRIRIDDHCYGCTAGSGSSCGGALDKEEDDLAEPMAV